MSKLIYRTKPPKKGYVNNESFMTHEAKGLRDKFPPSEVQDQAHEIVLEVMYDLIKKLKALGYDETKVGFYIHYLNNV